MSLLPSSHSNNLTPRRGIAKFAPKNDDGSLQAAINMSPSAEMTFNQEPETTEYISAESGINEILDSTTLSLPRTISLTCNNLSNEIKALFFVADVEELSQAATPVTGELTGHVFKNRSVQLGGEMNNSGGVFDISAVTVEAFADERADNTVYEVGDIYKPQASEDNDHFYVCTVEGTSAAESPTFTTNGTTFADGGATFKDLGLRAFTVDDDYELDTDYAIINILDTGHMAEAIDACPADSKREGRTFFLTVDYTPAAKTITQIATKEEADLEGEFWFYEQNPKGTNTVWHCPRVTISPTGELAAKSGSDYGSCEFEISVLKHPTLPAMTQNGVPVT